MNDVAFRERLSALIEAAGGLSATARLTGMSREQVAKWRSGAARPPLLPLAQVAQHAAISLDWLVHGPPLAMPLTADGFDPAFLDKVVSLPVLALERGSGEGADAGQGQGNGQGNGQENGRGNGQGNGAARPRLRTAPSLPFSRALLDALGEDVDRLAAWHMRDDSMAPAIRAGALVVVDRGSDRIGRDGVYALVLGDDIRLRRVARSFSGAVRLIADNEAYPTEEIGPEAAGRLGVAGRVVWVGAPL